MPMGVPCSCHVAEQHVVLDIVLGQMAGSVQPVLSHVSCWRLQWEL